MVERKKILVTGANGQLGKELRDISKEFNQYEFLFLSREDLPIHHYDLVRNTFDAFKPDYCINCAAYTAVDRAEQESELAFIINAESVGILAAVSAAHGTRFIHISTDYVYGGDAATPYKETDPTAPQSVYGRSKKAGEEEALKHDPEAVIIRTSWVYSYYGNNFVKTMIRLMNEKEQIGVVSDQKGSPTSAADLASFIMYVIGYPSWQPGIYNFSNEGEITWYEFAVEIKKQLGSQCLVNPIPTSAYPTPAKRPAYSVMDKTKIKKMFRYELKDWDHSLTVCMKRLMEQ